MKKRTITAYALPAFALAVVGIPIYIYIPKFYTDTLGLPVSLAGISLLAIRAFDAITDPLMGFISDRTRTPMGRRRPYLLAGSTLLSMAILALFHPPDLDARNLSIWFVISLALVFLFWTVTVVPYEALGPELTRDVHTRTVLFSARDGALIAGTMVAASIPVAIRAAFSSGGSDADDKTLFLTMALICIPLIIGCCLICFFAVKEKLPRGTPEATSLSQVLETFKNRPFVILISAFAFGAIAAQMPATLILFYVEHVLRSSRAEIFLLIYFVTGIFCLPFWVSLAKHTGKKRAWMGAMLINTGAFFFVFWLGQGDELWYGILVCLSGVGFGAGLALPSALTADVIDYDASLSGQRREGQYVGVFSVAKKMAGAAGAGIGLWILGIAGYVPGQPQSDDVIFALRILYALVPCILSIAGLIIAGFYPLRDPPAST